eukprot:gnl/MRDRNA2_/MRDRNA2_96620_c0_seq1.p1 gnl/MRDRNA2_/MRDRNA2_96620_c0~~gnl/MRDRNA2_/MRDRNA2_96620_c0_seq1.p1  ORF type:complete len:293 (+),score=53.49 gnl/MRDRNA2_/MRDRNA2_96620_c0_seq1:89-967(+)
MGNVCQSPGLKGGAKCRDINLAEGGAPMHSGATSHMIIVAIDYLKGAAPLTCTKDGNNMKALAATAGIQDLVCLFENDANKAKVTQTIKEVGSRCEQGDYFIFFYSGHGSQMPDENGDEKDGMDEAICLINADGTEEPKTDDPEDEPWMSDDEFADLVTSSVAPGVKILIICDCCSSGTIGDFTNAGWNGHEAVSLSGCTDSQCSEDTGEGGVCTHSLLLAVQQMHDQGEQDYSVGQLYNIVIEKDQEVFQSIDQDIQLKWTSALSGAESMAWPMIPDGNYEAPWEGEYNPE